MPDLRLWLTQEFLDGEATEPPSDEEIQRAVGVMFASERSEHAESLRFWRDENARLRAALLALRDLPGSVVACALRPPAEDWDGNAYPHDEATCERCVAVAGYQRRCSEVDAQVDAVLGSAPAEKPDQSEPVTGTADAPPTCRHCGEPESEHGGREMHDDTSCREMHFESEPPSPMCDVLDCAEDAVTEINGRLRLNPGEGPIARWVDVEFNLCAAHEAEHDRCHGEPPMVSAPQKTEVQP